MTRWNSLLKPCLKNISSGMNLGPFVPMVHIFRLQIAPILSYIP